jgi:hypothetical protein
MPIVARLAMTVRVEADAVARENDVARIARLVPARPERRLRHAVAGDGGRRHVFVAYRRQRHADARHPGTV